MDDKLKKKLRTVNNGVVVKGDKAFMVPDGLSGKKVLLLHDMIGDHYDEVWWNKDHKRYVVIKGSRASKKSFTVAYRIIVGMMENPKVNTLVMRATYNSLKGSCWAMLKKVVYMLGYQKKWKISQSPLEFTIKETGQQILFRGLNDPLALSSIGVDNAGYLCWAWLEEAYQVSNQDDFEKIDQSIRGETPGAFKQIFITFNPWLKTHWLRTRFFETEDGRPLNDPDTLALTTDYTMNEWLDAADLRMFNRMKELNPQMYQVAGLGNWGNPQGLIYNNWEEEDFDINDVRKLPGIQLCIGLDFGYSEDPAALCCSYVDTINNVIYVFDELYERHLSNKQLAAAIKKMGYGKEVIIADSEAPKDIDDLWRNYGLTHITAAYKYPGSVLSQIQRVQDYRIKIHPRCVNFKIEISSYAWKVDNEGRTLARPADFSMDHLCVMGDTLVTTDKGDIPIKDVKVGMGALTLDGFHTIVAQSFTGHREVWKIETNTGRTITLTPDHMLWCDNDGTFKRADSFRLGDTLLVISPQSDGGQTEYTDETICRITCIGLEDVYNITVEKEHTAFFNGIYSKQCDALKYSLDTLDKGAGEYIGSVGDKEERKDLEYRYGDKEEEEKEEKKDDDDGEDGGGWCYSL